MKERIYSIPLTDALRENCGCILCTIEKKLEEDAAIYYLGPSLMEPDNREITNDKGFCKRHMKMLLEGANRLGLALMLETHISELKKKIKPALKQTLFSKSTDALLTASTIQEAIDSCALCDKLSAQMKDAAGNLSYLWKEDKDFRRMFEESANLCLEHSALVLSVCDKELGGKKREEFINMILDGQKNELDALYDDLHSFTLFFDYRNTEKPSKKVSESVESAVKYLSKF